MAARSFLSAYVLIGILNVIAVASDNADAVLLTKPLLMPLLVGWLIATARRDWSTTQVLLLAGLLLAWAGDLLLLGEGDVLFMLGLIAFLAMQVLYLAAFVRVPGRGLVRARPVVIAPYAIALMGLVVATWPGAGVMRLPGIAYVVILTLMAVAALDLVGRLPAAHAWRAAAGGALFMVSDGLIALTAFGPLDGSPTTSAAVMATYIAAQGLILVGLTRGVQAEAAASSAQREGRGAR
jgi:uncharacterized membrane protein YhhN